MIHNHDPEEGEGLACNELRLPDGSIRGACIITPEERLILTVYNESVRLMINQYERLGVYVEEEDFEPDPEWWATIKEKLKGELMADGDENKDHKNATNEHGHPISD